MQWDILLWWQVLVARRAVHELQRGAEEHEAARGRAAGHVGLRHRIPRRRQRVVVAHVGCSESRSCDCSRVVLHGVSVACYLHREELLFSGFHSLLQLSYTLIIILGKSWMF